jgi:glycine/D-amino acid oxidase-like deaminating enzyme
MQPLWRDQAYASFPSLDQDIETEVCIVGAGITGASAAYALSRDGKASVVLDKGIVAGGATEKNLGMLVPGLHMDFYEAIDLLGHPGVGIWRTLYDSFEKLKSTMRQHSIGELEEKGSFYLAFTDDEAATLRKELEARERYGFPGELLDAKTLRSRIDTRAIAALHTPTDAGCNSVGLVHGLLSHSGARVFENTPCTIDGSTVRTPHGTVSAEKIIIATESFTPNDQFALEKHEDYVCCTGPVDVQLDGALLWDAGRDYTSIRRIGDRIALCVDVDDPANAIASAAENARRRLMHHFGKELAIERVWHGTIAHRREHVPFIGKLENGAYFSGGYDGHGMTGGFFGGSKLAEFIVDNKVKRIF